MKVIIQRTNGANVKVYNELIGEISKGLVALVGFTESDSEKDIQLIAEKMVNLRIFEDENNKMNRSLIDMNGEILSVSQFTLYADVKKGRRPSFIKAANPEKAKKMYELFNSSIRQLGVKVETGKFGAMMEVGLVNDGPVTIILETENGKWIEG